MLDKDEIEVSLVVPCYNEEKNIKNFTKFLQHIVGRKIEIRYMW